MGETGGLIFSNYRIEEFDTDMSRFDAMAIGQDFGFNHANAILTLGYKDGDIYVCNELYVHEMDTTEIIQKLTGSSAKVLQCGATVQSGPYKNVAKGRLSRKGSC